MKTIKVPVWYSNGGGMMVNRDCLNGDDPEHTYNWVMRTFEGLVDPERFGIRKPIYRKLTGDWFPSPQDPRF